nr:MAG TPA: hypothetical protein [Caudoviricetes sp.]
MTDLMPDDDALQHKGQVGVVGYRFNTVPLQKKALDGIVLLAERPGQQNDSHVLAQLERVIFPVAIPDFLYSFDNFSIEQLSPLLSKMGIVHPWICPLYGLICPIKRTLRIFPAELCLGLFLAGDIRSHDRLKESVLLILGKFAAGKQRSVVRKELLDVTSALGAVTFTGFLYVVVLLDIGHGIFALVITKEFNRYFERLRELCHHGSAGRFFSSLVGLHGSGRHADFLGELWLGQTKRDTGFFHLVSKCLHFLVVTPFLKFSS